jgi:transcriptional regulator with XRE-family HTH domain
MPRPLRDLNPYASLVDFFGAELRKYRTDAGLSQPQLAESLGCTATWIGKIETGESCPSEATALDLDTYFTTNGTFWRLWRLIKQAGKNLALPPWLPQFIELEAEANSHQSFEAQVIPGLLQTEAYARAVMSAGQTPKALDERVAARMERQAIHNRDNPPRMWFVLDEAVIRRPIGGHEVMRQQLEHLLKLMDEALHLQIRVLPFSSATYAGLDGSFRILGFENKPDIAYHEGPEISQLIEDPAIVAEYAVRFDLVMGEALPRVESLKMITSALEDYT